MGLIGNLARNVITDVVDNPLIESGRELADGVVKLAGRQIAKVVADPLGSVHEVVHDIPVAVFGRQPDLLRDASDLAKDALQFVVDTGINVFNALPINGEAPVFAHQPGSIDVQAGKTIVQSGAVSGASLGDLSWLIYNQNRLTNDKIKEKWQLYNFTETVSGYDSSTYVDAAAKQVAITFEGTSPNSALSPWVLSKDGATDVEIGIGVIPNQVVEGYGRFKALMDNVQQEFVSKGYGVSLAGHSLGGGLAEMMSGMYFLDTGIALPTLSEESPGMLRQLRMYAEEQLLKGYAIHLPSGGSVKLQGGTLLERAKQAKAIAGSLQAQDFSNVINLLTEQDPVGQVRYDADPTKDGHVGVNIIMPAILTARECLQDLDYAGLRPIDDLGIVTPNMPQDWLNLFPGLSGMDLSRIDRHLPAQSEGLWSGTSLGLYDPNGAIGLGVQIERTNGEPVKQWSGSKLDIPEVRMFGTATARTVHISDTVKGKQNALYVAGGGGDTVYGSDNGDMIVGGTGDDLIFGGNGDNYLSGGGGNDRLYGGSGNDIIYAGNGNAFMTGGGGDNLLFGGKGHDTFYWQSGNDILFNGQAGGTYDFVIEQGAHGCTELKWQRNFCNIGTSMVQLNGALDRSSHLLFNFVDEIHFADMKWSENGTDIVMTDLKGDKAGSVTFKNALQTFAVNPDQLDFKFANGALYSGDQLYHVCSGRGVISASNDPKYAGSLLVASADGDTLKAGSGSDVLFGGAGADQFVFGDRFGRDTLVGATGADTVVFGDALNPADFCLRTSGSDLVISYGTGGNGGELTISGWGVAQSKVDDFQLADGVHYRLQNGSFVRK